MILSLWALVGWGTVCVCMPFSAQGPACACVRAYTRVCKRTVSPPSFWDSCLSGVLNLLHAFHPYKLVGKAPDMAVLLWQHPTPARPHPLHLSPPPSSLCFQTPSWRVLCILSRAQGDLCESSKGAAGTMVGGGNEKEHLGKFQQ